MATWEDGPEYAPLERPQYYADAPLPPLEQVPPPSRPADGLPGSRPRFDQPSAPVAPLETLVPVPPDERDPNRPFDVVNATMTTQSAWGSWGTPSAGGSSQPAQPTALAPLTPGPSAQGAPLAPAARPVAGAPWPVLEQPGPAAFPQAPTPYPPPAPGVGGPSGPNSPNGMAGPGPQGPYGYPAPGTPGWFAPPPTSYGEQPPGRVDAKQVVEAATPGLCICLAVGGLIYVLAPIMLVLAVFLSMRVQVAQRAVRIAFRAAAGAVGFFAVVGLFRSVVDGDPWWSFVGLWSLLICWIMLGVLLLVVWQSLTRPQRPTNPWG